MALLKKTETLTPGQQGKVSAVATKQQLDEPRAVELSEDDMANVAGGGDNPLLADLVDLNTACLYGLTNGNTVRICGSPDVEKGTPHCRYFETLEMNPNLTMMLCAWRARNR